MNLFRSLTALYLVAVVLALAVAYRYRVQDAAPAARQSLEELRPGLERTATAIERVRRWAASPD
jgi:hypothetical protein